MSEIININSVSLSDLVELQNISRQTFIETFSADNTEENMTKYLIEAFSSEKLTAELNDAESEFYFAEFDARIIGYLKLNAGQSQTEIKGVEGLEIERIYVLKEYQGMKVGQMLYQKALQIARYKGVQYVWLGVWEKNIKAIGFYKKNGFVEFDQHVFKFGNEEQTDIMMKNKMISNDGQ